MRHTFQRMLKIDVHIVPPLCLFIYFFFQNNREKSKYAYWNLWNANK